MFSVGKLLLLRFPLDLAVVRVVLLCLVTAVRVLCWVLCLVIAGVCVLVFLGSGIFDQDDDSGRAASSSEVVAYGSFGES